MRTVDGQDDFASLREVLSRRLARLASEQDDHPAEPAAGAPAEVEPDGLREAADASAPARPETPKQGPRKFAYPPSLIVVDGGRPQLGAAMEALEQAGRTDLAVIGLAKRMEEVYVPGSPDPLVLPRASEALYLLQRVRDEAHRFAIAYHRKLRGRSMTRSVLDGIPGVGEARRKELVRHFGSPRKVAQASVDEIAALPGFGPRLAKTVWDHLHGASS